MIRKLIIGNGRTEREILLVGNILIGRDPACHVSEPDPLLSRRHAEILSSVHGVSVRDLDSRNGVLVNGEKTREQVLFSGDVIQMGHLQVRYVEEQPRPADGLASRGLDRRPTNTPAPLPFDRYRPDPTPRPGRWKPEPTPLPGRHPAMTSQPPARVKTFTPVPRGRAAFEDPPPAAPPVDPPDRTVVMRPSGSDPAGPLSIESEVTLLAPLPGEMPRVDRRRGEDTLFGEVTDSGDVRPPGDATFAYAVSHLAGLVDPGAGAAGPVAQLTADAELTVTSATPSCAELLGVPGETLVGDSLPDIFLRGVRRVYAESGSTLTLQITSNANGSIAVTLGVSKTGGNQR